MRKIAIKSNTKLPIDVAGVLIMLRMVVEKINIDNRFSKYIQTSCNNMVPFGNVQFTNNSRRLVYNKLFKNKKPEDIKVASKELIGIYGEEKIVMLFVIIDYLKHISKERLPIDKYGQIMVIYGMLKRLLEEMTYENK